MKGIIWVVSEVKNGIFKRVKSGIYLKIILEFYVILKEILEFQRGKRKINKQEIYKFRISDKENNLYLIRVLGGQKNKKEIFEVFLNENFFKLILVIKLQFYIVQKMLKGID